MGIIYRHGRVTLRIVDTLGHRVLDVMKNQPGCFACYRHGFALTDDRQHGLRNCEISIL
jgi:hypothetical protein